MDKILPFARQLARARWLPPVAILLVLLILGGTIHLGSRQLRDGIGRQMVERDAVILDAVAVLNQADSERLIDRQIDDPAGQFALALRLSQIKPDVLAVRLFDTQGRFVVSIPGRVRTAALDSDILQSMARLNPVSRFQPHARLDEAFLPSPGGPPLDAGAVPVSSVFIPLHAEGRTNLLAVAEFVQDGTGLARELAVLDRQIRRQALTAFLVAGGLVGLGLGWAFRQLQLLTRRLHDQASSLRQANQALALAAKTSALGAVTAHVVHGLTSPLNGLEQFVASHAGADAEWQDAIQGTRRMQALLGDIVRVLGEDAGDARYEIPLCELRAVLAERIRPACDRAHVRFESACDTTGQLANCDANLVLLILENLLNNAVQAAPAETTVHLTVSDEAGQVRCLVADRGPGLPDRIRRDLFSPVRSTKPGGNGLGLALSRHLARHLGADLTLLQSGPTGTTFALDLPQRLFEPSLEPFTTSADTTPVPAFAH